MSILISSLALALEIRLRRWNFAPHHLSKEFSSHLPPAFQFDGRWGETGERA